jgi:signal transduction histidine kinase
MSAQANAHPALSHAAMRRAREDRRWSMVIGLAVAALLLMMWWGGLFTSARLRLNDVAFVSAPATGQIRIIAIDDASFERYGRSLTDWSRRVFADVVTWLSDAGARAVVFDVLFVEPSEDDAVLAAALRAAREGDTRLRAVLPVVGVERGDADAGTYRVGYADVIQPPRQLRESADFLGYINAYPDFDNTIRRQISAVQHDDEMGYGLSIMAYLAYLRIPSSAIEQVLSVTEAGLQIGSTSPIPVNPFGLWMPNYFHTPNDTASLYPTDSLRAVLAGDIDPAAYADKIVFIGVMNSTALTDLYVVPATPYGRLTAGVELHANATETLIQSNALVEQPRWTQAVLIGVFALGASLLYARMRWRWILPVALSLTGIWLVIGLTSFSIWRVVLNMFDPILALTIPAVAMLLVHIAREARARRTSEFLLHSVVDVSQQRMAIDHVLPTIADDLQQLFPEHSGAIWLVDDERKSLKRGHSWVISGASVVDERLAARAYQQAIVINQPPQLAMPVIWQGRVIAVFSTAGRDKAQPRPQALELMLELAEQIAPSLENALLYDQVMRQKHTVEQASEFKTQMIRMASHDLNNPLTNILVTANLLLDPEYFSLSDERVKKSVERMQRASEQMRQIIQDILSLERVRGAVVFKSAFDVGELVQEVAAQVKADADAKNQIFTLDIDDALPIVSGDRQLLYQAVVNLIGNAIKYTPDGGSVAVRVTGDIASVCVEVEDSGYGIPEKDQRSIFREFFRAKTSAVAHIPGTGLGLSLVKSVVQAHGGSVWFRSVEGEGSTFFMELPSEKS